MVHGLSRSRRELLLPRPPWNVDLLSRSHLLRNQPHLWLSLAADAAYFAYVITRSTSARSAICPTRRSRTCLPASIQAALSESDGTSTLMLRSLIVTSALVSSFRRFLRARA